MMSGSRFHRRVFLASALVGVLLSILVSDAFAGSVKNVIVLIPDGQHASVQTLARWYRGEPLALDEMVAGTVATDMVNSVVTGSAAAATAMATGYKTTVRFLAVGPRPEDALSTYRLPWGIPAVDEEASWNWFAYRPLPTVLEGAQRIGKATGLVATSNISHATPAGFAAHVDDRGKDNEIMKQLVYQNVDVVFGGGRRHLLPVEQGGHRTDGEDLLEVLAERGYQTPATASELDALTGGRAWGLFASNHMMPDLDRRHLLRQDELVTEPSLAEMTAKAIELLSKNPDGFLLMVEGSQIDWGGHANDPIYHLHEFLAFDDAVRVALDFARENGETLLLGAPDHGCGGMSIGNYATSDTCTRLTVEELLNPLRSMSVTADYLAGQLPPDPDAIAIKATVREYWDISLSDEDVAGIRTEAEAVGYAYAIAKIVSANHTVIGWTTHGHTGDDVPLWTFGPMAPAGHIDNTEIASIVAGAFGLNLHLGDPRGLSQVLFVDAEEAFPGRTRSDLTDPENPVLIISHWRLQASKDLIHWGDRYTRRLDGLVVYSPNANDSLGRWFIPQMAVDVINSPELRFTENLRQSRLK